MEGEELGCGFQSVHDAPRVCPFELFPREVRRDDHREHTVIPFRDDAVDFREHPVLLRILSAEVVEDEERGLADAFFETRFFFAVRLPEAVEIVDERAHGDEQAVAAVVDVTAEHGDGHGGFHCAVAAGEHEADAVLDVLPQVRGIVFDGRVVPADRRIVRQAAPLDGVERDALEAAIDAAALDRLLVLLLFLPFLKFCDGFNPILTLGCPTLLALSVSCPLHSLEDGC